MDQVKVYLGVAKKHHFWILAVIVIVTAVVVWSKASGSLATLYQTRKQQIESAESSLQKASSEERVNDTFTQKVDGLHDGLKQRVFDAWKHLYERQVALFKWPVRKTDDGNAIDLNLLGPNDEIPQYVRSFYNESVVKDEWEELLSKINLRRPREVEVPTVEESGDEEEEVIKRGMEYEGLVVWSEPLRKAIIDRYYTPNATPSSTRLRLMQEDAWLFDSLVEIVNAVNDGATDPLRAPIKQIDVLDVAQWAIAASVQSGGGITVPGASTAPGAGMMNVPTGMMNVPTGMMNAPGAGGPPGLGAGGGSTATSGAPAGSGDNDNAWKEGRYLDEKGQPLKGDAHPFAEFRQMFVYMKFIMDQRRIPNLVAASANAPLPIETRQIRVQTLKEGDTNAGNGLFPQMGGGMGMGGGMMGGGTPGGAPGAGMMGDPNYGMMPGMGGGMPAMGGGMPAMGGGMPGMGGGMPGMGGGMPGMGPGMMGGGMPGMGPGMMGGGMMGGAAPQGFGLGAQEGAVETTVYDAIVELSGVIYLYNPPDITKLGTGGAGAPEKRSFGVPKTAVPLPGAAPGSSGSMSPSMTSVAK